MTCVYCMAHARWAAWAYPARPSASLEEPILARLRSRTPGEVTENLAALDRECARERGCAVAELPWRQGDEVDS